MFSVLITTYNGSKYIIDQINSIVNQTKKVDFIYVYDDCSKDNTIDIINNWIKTNNVENVVVRKNVENKGYTRNFLEALFEIDDEYIFLCDQDDVWENNKVETYYDCIKKSNIEDACILYTSGYYVTDSDLKVKKVMHSKSDVSKYIDFYDFVSDCSYPGMTFCISRDLKELAKENYNIQYVKYHDYFLSMLALKYGKMICIERPLVLYRQHANNQLGVSGSKLKSNNHWKNVLTQKENELLIALYCFPDNNFLIEKNIFIKKRMYWFRKRKILSIILNIYLYKKFYNLKSFMADIYYCVKL